MQPNCELHHSISIEVEVTKRVDLRFVLGLPDPTFFIIGAGCPARQTESIERFAKRGQVRHFGGLVDIKQKLIIWVEMEEQGTHTHIKSSGMCHLENWEKESERGMKGGDR